QIHFHEVGTLDALADVVGCCLLFSMIGAEKIICSPIHVGNGFVHCAHGILPVPAPATAEILKGIPYYTGEVDTELCTPTGAALLRHFVTEFASMPAMSVRACGIGHGTKELPALNAVRTFLGDMFDESSDKKNDMTGEVLGDRSESFSDQITDISCNIDDMTDKKSETRQSADCEPDCSDKVADISCNIDDMTGEALGYAMEVLLGAGALDVFYVPVQMKKNRPGILLHCLCKPEETEHFAELILRHTTTRGVRFQNMSRLTLTSETETVATPYGEIKKKISRGHGIEKSKYEFEDLRRIATAHDISLQEITSTLPRP
ncbi:MAG: LarC family nickel insertion protein, partial [Clostridiales bacterium]|nr:LarC family nickel insertion protein [Clostridiales bacterium]